MRDLSLLKVEGGNHFDEWTFCIQRKAETLKKTPTSKDDDRSRNVIDLPKFVKTTFFNSLNYNNL